MKVSQAVKTKLLILVYLSVFTLANFLVYWFGPKGLVFTSLLLIPFDFVVRCYFHENWKGKQLLIRLTFIVIAASTITFLINKEALNIALGSATGFFAAQLFSGLLYQYLITKRSIIKVNLSDLAAITADSIVFQLVAFQHFNYQIILSQLFLKIIGGLFWYFILIERFNIIDKE